jgi:hypothetical protein
MSYMKLGQPDAALPDFTEANRLSGGAPVTQAHLAGAYARVGRTDDTHAILANLMKPGKVLVRVAGRCRGSLHLAG